MTFNILAGNTNAHARNHAAFWDGENVTLTPAYDTFLQSRARQDAWQAMRIHGFERHSQLSLCLAAANTFLLTKERALVIAERHVAAIAGNWQVVCYKPTLAGANRRLLWRHQFLNNLAFEGLKDRLADVVQNPFSA